MIVENRGQQQSIRYVIDTDRCCGCKKCIRRCMENVWHSGMKKKNMLIRNIRMNVYCVISVRWIV